MTKVNYSYNVRGYLNLDLEVGVGGSVVGDDFVGVVLCFGVKVVVGVLVVLEVEVLEVEVAFGVRLVLGVVGVDVVLVEKVVGVVEVGNLETLLGVLHGEILGVVVVSLAVVVVVVVVLVFDPFAGKLFSGS